VPARGEEESWDVVYYRQVDGETPAIDFLDGCPIKLQARFDAVLDDVAAASPPRYSGGGRWEAMHGDMGGFYEVRLGGSNREQFRLFCILDNGSAQQIRDRGLTRPAIAVITGMRKPFMTVFDEHDYAGVRRLGDEYRAQLPRRIKT
jgi:hypothetical protein